MQMEWFQTVSQGFPKKPVPLTSLTINQRILAPQFLLYGITNTRARIQPFQSPTFSCFKRWIRVGDLESQFHFWIFQL